MLCEVCVYREQSRKCVQEFLQTHEDISGKLVCDPAPKVECKLHEGYGYEPPESKDVCRDFRGKDTV